MTDKKIKPNRLIHEKSPYLLQHAYNPVDWYPWCDEAFYKAEREDKPVFLSIGYSTCHWCHVMAEESFEDIEVATLMNDAFICIKVDREERPDIDDIYMKYCQLFSSICGWPLNVQLTPKRKPFFAVSYLPKRAVGGNIGMLEFIPYIKKLWEEERDDLIRDTENTIKSLAYLNQTTLGDYLTEDALKQGFRELKIIYDKEHGGIGKTMKFPQPHYLWFLLRIWKRYGDKKALSMVETTLTRMRMGGIYDHIGYGFHRYTTDREWKVPHFEKMLYDQALTAIAYIEAYQATGKDIYKNTAEEIFQYVEREMMSPEGGFYTAEDADSEGEEGKYYTWEYDELKDVLSKQELELVTEVFGIEVEGNFNDEATGKKTGRNIIYINKSLEDIAKEKKIDRAALEKEIEKIREKLFKGREKREKPFKDDKILTDWNGLMIAAFARAAKAFGNKRYAAIAEKAADFILDTMRGEKLFLCHRYRDGEAGVRATVKDYAFIIWGLLELYEVNFKYKYLENAYDINEYFLRNFWDADTAGFFINEKGGKDLIMKDKDLYDREVPSGNSVALINLIKMSRYLGTSNLEHIGQKITKVESFSIADSPLDFINMLVGVDYMIGPSYEVVVVADKKDDETEDIINRINGIFSPNKVVILKAKKTEKELVPLLKKHLEDKDIINDKPTIYCCMPYMCQEPTNNVEEVIKMLT